MKKLTPIPNTAVHVKTQAEYVELMQICEDNFNWSPQPTTDTDITPFKTSKPIIVFISSERLSWTVQVNRQHYTILTLQELKDKLSEGDTMKFKVGQTVKVVKSYSPGLRDQIGKIGEITGIISILKYHYEIKGVEGSWREDELELVERTIRDVQPGDILVYPDTLSERTIVEVLPNVICVKVNDKECVVWWTFEDTESAGWKIKETTPPPTTVTRAEVAKAMGIPEDFVLEDK